MFRFLATSTRQAARFSTSASISTSSKAPALVTIEKRGSIAILRLNDPKRLNPMTNALGAALRDRVAEINARADEFSAVVLTGEGRAFCAGGDLQFLEERASDTPTRNSVIMRDFYGCFLSLRSLHMPLVAAINGPAIGAGLCISLFADMRVAAADAKMGFNFVHLGLHPGMASTHFLPMIAGPETASYLFLSGKLITGAEAKELRIVHKAVPTEGVLDEAVNLANELSAPSSMAMRAVLRSLRNKQNDGLELALQREADAQAHSYGTDDFREGLAALKARRAPTYGPLEAY